MAPDVVTQFNTARTPIGVRRLRESCDNL